MPRKHNTESDYKEMYQRFANDMLISGNKYTLKQLTIMQRDWLSRPRGDKYAPKRPVYATKRQHNRLVREAKHEGSLINNIEKRTYSYVRNGKVITATQYRDITTNKLTTKEAYDKEVEELDEY